MLSDDLPFAGRFYKDFKVPSGDKYDWGKFKDND